MIDFSKYEGLIEELNEEVKKKDFEEIPDGTYEVKVDEMELKESKKGDLMLYIRFTILEGNYKKFKIFYHQVLKNKYGRHFANEMLRDLSDGTIEIKLKNWPQYQELIEEVENITKQYEYALDYYTDKEGYKKYEIVDVFEIW